MRSSEAGGVMRLSEEVGDVAGMSPGSAVAATPPSPSPLASSLPSSSPPSSSPTMVGAAGGGGERLSILHVMSNLAAAYGGPVQVCRDLAKRQAADGHRVVVFATNVDYPIAKGDRDVPLDRPVETDGYAIRYFKTDFRPLLFSWSMHRALAREVASFDIVHVHGIYRFPNFLGGYHAQRQRVPYWVRPYGSLDPFLFHKKERRRLKRIYERFFVFPLLNRASAIHYTTEDERQLVEFLGLRPPAVVIPNGIDVAAFRDLPPRGAFRARHGLGDAKLVMHFGRITMKKGLDLLTAAIGRLAATDPSIRLAIVGPDNEGYTAQVERWIAEHGIGPMTIIPGIQTGRQKLEALVDADIFALPSYAENFGVSVVEAMAVGTPVVISDRVGIHHEVAQAGAGRVVPTGDVPALARALGELLNDEAARHEAGAKAKAFALDHYDWARIVPRMEAAYRSTIRGVAHPG